MSRRAAAALAFCLLAGCAHDPFPDAPPLRPLREAPAGPRADCTRAQPAALLRMGAPMVLSTSFRKISPYRAEERARLRGNVLLTVAHEGCTRSGYVFRFRLLGDRRRRADRPYWYRRAAELMAAVGVKDFRDLNDALRRSAAAPPAYGTWVRVGEFQRYAVEILSERRASIVEVRYAFAL
ncbi:MAG: hypothetical protein ABIJ96_01395 [Elusimicrobiota bacterium]